MSVPPQGVEIFGIQDRTGSVIVVVIRVTGYLEVVDHDDRPLPRSEYRVDLFR
jgi:hypothetical protein